MLGQARDWNPPKPLLRAGLYWPDTDAVSIEAIQAHWVRDAPVSARTFYRALLQSGTLAPMDGLIRALSSRGLNALPIYISGLKDPAAESVFVFKFSGFARLSRVSILWPLLILPGTLDLYPQAPK